MTIAACYITQEGVVLGADSTASFVITPVPGHIGFHYYNHNQKLFEIGESSTAGVITWGLGNLQAFSYRTLVANLDDQLRLHPPQTFADVAAKWCDVFWAGYDADSWVQRCRALGAKQPYAPPAAAPAPPSAGTAPVVTGTGVGAGSTPAAAPAPPPHRTLDEENEFKVQSQNLVAGFCLGGYWLPDRTPMAFTVVFDPLKPKPQPVQLAAGQGYAWGAPNLIRRFVTGIDDNAKAAILSSGKWQGVAADLDAILAPFALGPGTLPIRDAVDYVHMCIQATIKGMKFSSLFQICGGPIELAVITTDRKFRWVRHKTWDSAIEES